MACQRILVSSEQYCLCIRIDRSKWMQHAEILFVSKDGQTGYRKKSVLNFHKYRDERDAPWRFSAPGWDITVEKGYPLRLVGHVLNFLNGEDILFDVNLKRCGEKDHVQLFAADGNLLIGDDEYLFAPAHSAALIIPKENSSRTSCYFACVRNRVPYGLLMDGENSWNADIKIWNGRDYAAEFNASLRENDTIETGTATKLLEKIIIEKMHQGTGRGGIVAVLVSGTIRAVNGQDLRLQKQLGVTFKGA